MKKIVFAGLMGASAVIGGIATFVYAQHSMQGHGAMHSQHHGGGQMQHDMVNMPMLHGKNTTQQEFDNLRAMFLNHPEITRTVELIPNGIRTVTETKNEELRANIVGHVAEMIARVDAADNPEIPIQSPTLTILFERGDTIVTDIEPTDLGVMVTQTSTDLEVVAALQTHAGEVSDLAARGMQAVHEQMMDQHH